MNDKKLRSRLNNLRVHLSAVSDELNLLYNDNGPDCGLRDFVFKRIGELEGIKHMSTTARVRIEVFKEVLGYLNEK